MKYSDKLRAKMATALDRQKSIVATAEAENREMTEAEVTAFDAETAVYEKTVKELERVDAMEAREAAAKAATKAARDDATGTIERVATAGAVQVNDNLTTHEIVGVCAWAAAKSHLYPGTDPLKHIEDAGFQKIADMSRETKAKLVQNKTFLVSGATAGGNTVTTPLSSEFIEFLRNESIFMAGGPTPVDLSYGTLDIAAGNATTSGTYTAEGADINYTEATTRKVSLSAKHLSAVTAISNYNIEVSPLAIAAILGDDLAMGLTLSMDSAGLRGDGTGANPAGILTLVNAAHKFAVTTATTASSTYQQIDAEAKKMLSRIRASNIPKRRRRWLMSNRTFTYLQFMRDGNGNYVYPGLQAAAPTWYDNIPVLLSEAIPSNLGVGTDESELYLVDFGHVLMGIARALTLKASTEASYKNSGGTLVSAFSRDETVIRGVGSHDFDMRYDKAAVVLTGVKWA